jgi:hypothetical protein
MTNVIDKNVTQEKPSTQSQGVAKRNIEISTIPDAAIRKRVKIRNLSVSSESSIQSQIRSAMRIAPGGLIEGGLSDHEETLQTLETPFQRTIQPMVQLTAVEQLPNLFYEPNPHKVAGFQSATSNNFKNPATRAISKGQTAFNGLKASSPAPYTQDCQNMCSSPIRSSKNVQSFWLRPTIEALEDREKRSPFASTKPPRVAWWADRDLRITEESGKKVVYTANTAAVNGLLNAATVPPLGYYGDIKKLDNSKELGMSTDDVAILGYSKKAIAALHSSHDKRWEEHL